MYSATRSNPAARTDEDAAMAYVGISRTADWLEAKEAVRDYAMQELKDKLNSKYFDLVVFMAEILQQIDEWDENESTTSSPIGTPVWSALAGGLLFQIRKF
ncbi:hypothetical protein SEA_FORZA_62 [Gordonia phage Forza]|uniref:Uncharacterized protein n=1 Tax=Gordonia phage Forza TaxID=2571247 RepID=A0A650EZE9_9CAUD|nr:hypothetical protein PP303_gp062 [Gordonia phage Forza]QEM41532.1 hypothetical protein SEA_BOOPY_63 [Gordonia phage Boopy]QGT55055.1 hypothetical protein SEA_FORZA_62 [Gordonia phage Forza]UXE04205.1 hypothetical protein SEA_BLUENGOLD_61 [Gordonia phage BlueNGold]WBF03844.1 hypothetical protein SEA_MAREELIH_61 [Gordonia phage Mareelih]